MKKTMNALWSPRLVALSFSVLMLVLGCNSPTGPGGGSMPPDPGLLPIPGTPQILGINTDTNGNSTLSWSSVTGAETYKAYYSGSETCDYTAISNLTDTSYILPFYGWYKVSAANETGEGALSNAVERKEPVSMNGPAATPTLSIAPGSFDETTNVELSCTTPDALIYYSTDGSTPIVGTSSPFTSAIIVVPGETITITAIAAATGFANSDAVSGTYHIRNWEVVGRAGFSAAVANETAIAQGGDGTLYIAFRDGSVGNKATVMKYDGSTWTTLGGTGISAGAAYNICLAADSIGSIYLAYYDVANGGKATVRRYSGTSWSTLGTEGFTEGEALFLSLALHDDGISSTPYLGFQDGANAAKATVQVFSGSTWVSVGSKGFSPDTVYETSLAVGSNGTLYIAFRDANSENKSTAMRYDGSDWSVIGTAGFSSGEIACIDLTLDSLDVPYVAYSGGIANPAVKATVVKWDGDTWRTVGSSGFSSNAASYVCLALSNDGKLYVAYKDQGSIPIGGLTVKSYHGSDWTTLGPTGIRSSVADYISLVVDPSGVPFIAFKDGGTDPSGQATVLTWR